MKSALQIPDMILKRLVFAIFLMSLAITACHTNVTKAGKGPEKIVLQNSESTPGPVDLTFSKSSYGRSDTIKASILNKTDSEIVIGLRCGFYVEMSYQESVKGHWSENKELPYMRMKCLTRTYTIKPHDKYDFSLPSSLFNSTGSFRLLVSYSVATENASVTITSIPFEIR